MLGGAACTHEFARLEHTRQSLRRSASSEDFATHTLHRLSPLASASSPRERAPIPHPTRRDLTASLTCALLGPALLASGPAVALPHEKAPDGRVMEAVSEAFTENGIAEVAESGWTQAIARDPSSPEQWVNRGTSRLQFGQWAEAKADFDVALKLSDGDGLEGMVLNKRAAARAALDDWSGAIEDYKKAAKDPVVGSIASGNLALAFFQVGREATAVRVARNALDTDPRNLDLHCALCAFLWVQGSESRAEEEWEALQQGGNQLGAVLYNEDAAVDRVQKRWPPRATAALVAFLERKKVGVAMDFDGQEHTYYFA